MEIGNESNTLNALHARKDEVCAARALAKGRSRRKLDEPCSPCEVERVRRAIMAAADPDVSEELRVRMFEADHLGLDGGWSQYEDDDGFFYYNLVADVSAVDEVEPFCPLEIQALMAMELPAAPRRRYKGRRRR